MNLSNMLSARVPVVDQSAVKGEKGTGYEAPGDKGPFQCSNCSYFSAGLCSQPIMMRVSKMPKNGRGLVRVAPTGCCEYVDRVGGR